MMHLSQTTGYAILALGCLEEAGGKWVRVAELAASTGAPRAYLVKLLHRLAKSGLIRTKRGYRGGYTLSQSSASIPLLAITEAVDGNEWPTQCLLGYTACTDKEACPAHAFWVQERIKIQEELARLTLKDVVKFERGRRRRKSRSAGQPEVSA